MWRRERVRSIDHRIHRVALRKLRQAGSAESIEDLRVPPGNRLEALKGDRAGHHSIRINDEWRIWWMPDPWLRHVLPVRHEWRARTTSWLMGTWWSSGLTSSVNDASRYMLVS